jgi:hypothetical protein
MSCRVSSIAVANPAGPAPTTSTGISLVFAERMGAIVEATTPGRMSNDYSFVEGADRRLLRRRALGRGRAVAQTALMRWPCTGRDAELQLVGDALSGGSAGGLVIAGPAGVGKTRLVAEASEHARRQGCAVEWVRASRSARSMPLGAFAGLLPATNRRLPEGVELLAHVRHVLAERAAGRRLLLCVDDGQLLDDASAALLHQLVASGEAFALVSVRRDEPGPDALRAL